MNPSIPIPPGLTINWNIIEMEGCLRSAESWLKEGKPDLALECVQEARGWNAELALPSNLEATYDMLEDSLNEARKNTIPLPASGAGI